MFRLGEYPVIEEGRGELREMAVEASPAHSMYTTRSIDVLDIGADYKYIRSAMGTDDDTRPRVRGAFEVRKPTGTPLTDYWTSVMNSLYDLTSFEYKDKLGRWSTSMQRTVTFLDAINIERYNSTLYRQGVNQRCRLFL